MDYSNLTKTLNIMCILYEGNISIFFISLGLICSLLSSLLGECNTANIITIRT